MSESNKQDKRPKIDLNVLGVPGLKQSGGLIEEEWHPKLRGEYGPKVYREMADNSSVIGAIRYLINALVRQVEWRIEPASEDQEAIDVAEFTETCLIDMSLSFEDLISEVLSFLDFGWSFFETVFKIRRGETTNPETRSKYDDGRIGWRKIALRAQDTLDRWEFDEEDGGLRGMHQMDYYSGKQTYIPIEKALLFRTEIKKNNPEGRSIYRNAVVDYWYLKRISNIEAIGIERDMTGLLTMEVPLELLHPDATAAHRTLRRDFEKMLAELKRDEREFALIPPEVDKKGQPTGYKLKLLSSGGRRQLDTTKIKEDYKVNILQTVLAQFIQLGMGQTGSFALASSQTELFAVALGSFMDSITSVFNRFGIPRLMKVNGFPSDTWPELVHGDIESPPLAEIGAYIQALASAGQLPEDEAIQRKLLEIANLPMPEKDEGDVAQMSKSKKGGLKRRKAMLPRPKIPGNECPHCKETLPRPTPDECPSCGYVLTQGGCGEDEERWRNKGCGEEDERRRRG